MDRIKTTAVPILKRFLAGDNEVVFNIKKRGAAPLGGGEICFKCPASRNLKTIQVSFPLGENYFFLIATVFTILKKVYSQLQNSGMVKRVRGTAYSIRVSPAIANRIVESAKGILLKFLPDVYIHTDHCKSASSGKSPGTWYIIILKFIPFTFICSNIYNIKICVRLWIKFSS